MSSSSTPPTQRIAGSFSCINMWFASSSKPHWQITSVAPLSLHCFTMSLKYFSSCALSSSYFSTVSMSILCFVFGFGGSNGQVRMAIFASLISLSICGCEMSLSMGRGSRRSDVGVELEGVRSGVERRAPRCVGIETVVWAERCAGQSP
eukprot:31114-Pelagococcus_subviridis.AAC.5